MNNQNCLEYKHKCGLVTKTQLCFCCVSSFLHCCFRTPLRCTLISIFRRKQTGNKKARLLRKVTACSSKETEAWVVWKPAHGPTPCHCFWKSDPFFPALCFDGLWVGTRKGEDKIVGEGF